MSEFQNYGIRGKQKLFAKLNHLANLIRRNGRVSIYQAADALGITDVGYFKKSYIARLVENYRDISFDGKYLFTVQGKLEELEVNVCEDYS